MICSSLKKPIFEKFGPDLIILTGPKPEIDKQIRLDRFKGAFVLTGGTPAAIRFPAKGSTQFDFSVFSVRRSGAYISRL
jgi:hypothetical protein